VNVDQEAAAGDDLLSPPEETSPGRPPRRSGGGSSDRDDRNARSCAACRSHRQGDIVAPELDRPALGTYRQRPHGLRLDQLLL
jgi:hypothetical protein